MSQGCGKFTFILHQLDAMGPTMLIILNQNHNYSLPTRAAPGDTYLVGKRAIP